jgi:hypothetical protein
MKKEADYIVGIHMCPVCKNCHIPQRKEALLPCVQLFFLLPELACCNSYVLFSPLSCLMCLLLCLSKIPVESVKQFAFALNASQVTSELYLYESVDMRLQNPRATGDSYTPKETADAWQKTLAGISGTPPLESVCVLY